MAKILVIDDDKDIVEIVRYTLAPDKLEVLEARDGKEGMARASADRPDLIVLDVMMPELDGLTVCGRLSGSPETKDIPIIILTARGRMREAFAHYPSVKQFIEKPFEPTALQDEIVAILAAQRQKRA